MRTIFIFTVLMFPTVLWGQIINHFDNPDSKWNVAKTYPAANEQNSNFAATTTTIFGFHGDTTINGEQWFKLYSTSDSIFQSDLLYRGLLREENNIVFYLDTLNQLDTLYDFSLNVGDSFLFDLYGMYPEWLKVANVDSIQINGDFYKRLKFDEPTMNAFDELNEVWIEGIGSIHGPLFTNFPVKFSGEMPDSMLLTCSFSDNQYVWQHSSYSDCYVNIILSVNKTELHNFKIYPNPFAGQITIENSKIENYTLSILNSLGQIIRQEQIKANSHTMNLAELKTGVYLLMIDDQEKIKTLKIIKH
nr:T9SS type A sorting domain-containing protein [uncultured Draconibacterium sp.]